MNISECLDFLQFWINKKTGAWYTPDELVSIIDRGQMSLYSDIQPKYATSQHIKDALAAFRATYQFTPSTTISGFIVIPSDSNYINLLDVQIQYDISSRTIYAAVPMVNEDERSYKLNSQIDPVTITSPIGELVAPRFIRLYPTAGYTGTVTYLRRPVKPVFGYNVISGRVIVYDPTTSTQLEWSEEWINHVLIKALKSAGINLSDQEIAQWAEIQSQQNFSGVNRT